MSTLGTLFQEFGEPQGSGKDEYSHNGRMSRLRVVLLVLTLDVWHIRSWTFWVREFRLAGGSSGSCWWFMFSDMLVNLFSRSSMF
jgi:hypothetical protein